MRLYDWMAKHISRLGVKQCFALLGDANMQLAARLDEEGISFTYVRHEHCAVAASMAYARKTGQVGFSTVTCGPGLTQLMTALPAAVRARIPIVVLAGESPVGKRWYNQHIDQAPFVEATGARYIALRDKQVVIQGLEEAFVMAVRDQIPVVVGVPFDVQRVEMADPPPSYQVKLSALAHQKRAARPECVSALANLINSSQRIAIIAGLGASEPSAVDVCRQLAEKIDALLFTTLPARGLFSEDPYYLGISGGFSSDVSRKYLNESDLILAIGCSLASHNSDGGTLWPNARVAQVSEEPQGIFQGRVVAQTLVQGDAGLTVSELIPLVDEKPVLRRSERLLREIEETPIDSQTTVDVAGGIHPFDAVAILDQQIPKDWQLVNSSGHCSYFFSHMKTRPFKNFLTIREFGAIGNGISFAMGVARAEPQVPTVLFDGDGSVLMHIQELETIQRHQLPVIIVVFNDGGYGSEFHKLRAEGLGESGAYFGATDLASIAAGFGLHGIQVESEDELRAALEFLISEPQPALIDVRVSPKVGSPLMRKAH